VKTLDVSELPEYSFGARDPMWWGVVLLICIESTMFALMLTTYLYLHGNFAEWPPTGPSRAAFYPSLVGMLALLASVVPMVKCSRAAVRGELVRARKMLMAATALGLLFLACRWMECRHIAFRWDQHAYGSVFWTTLGLHTVHGVSSTVENLMLIVLLSSKRVEQKHRTDVECNALYWYFVVFAFFPLWCLFYYEGVR
jgi:cytochrome c oxidase subunit 3